MDSRPADPYLIDLVERAGHGDEQAWTELVHRYNRLVSYVVSGYRLPEAQQSDAVAATWLRLVEHISCLRDPSAIASWLATTARREALAAARENRRTEPMEAVADAIDLTIPDPDELLLGAERCAAVRAALARLPHRQQELLRLLSQDPAPSYEEIGALLRIPVGSIGPTRARALRRLRLVLEQGDVFARTPAGGPGAG
jgi:RNA polymerase sigma factor (sigma-70 family)